MAKVTKKAGEGTPLPGLYRKLARAQDRVERIRGLIRALEGRAVVMAPGRRKSRSAETKPPEERPEALANLLARLLRGRTMSATEAATRVRASGYSGGGVERLRALVVRLLTRDARFSRVSRGRYTSNP